jgi:putative phosphoesterase
MKKILLLSDTHGHIDDHMLKHIQESDEVWHAGDIGTAQVTDTITKLRPLRAVYGNIDSHELRLSFAKELMFQCEEVKVYMTHIGGRPGRYARGISQKLKSIQPQVFICGHSHILKVQYDEHHKLLFFNPGAIGKHGFHKVRTMLRFQIDKKEIKNLDVIEVKR